MLYPLKFKPVYKEKVWGGNKIAKIKNEPGIPEKCGESWEISGVQGDLSVVSEGVLKDNNIQELTEIFMGDLVGDKIFKKYGIEFPLLIKIIDATEDLSVQVHPGDEFAKKQHNAFGKTEAWYMLETDKNAKIVYGFNDNISQYEFLEKVKNNQVPDIVNHVPVSQGEVFEIPAGTIHATGKGVLLLEVQQTSDVTYRIFDYNRKEKRELHIDLASEVLNYSKTEEREITFSRKPDQSNRILVNEFFTMNFLPLMNIVVKDFGKIDSFIIYFCTNGKILFDYAGQTYSLSKGETILIPAMINEIKIIPETYSELIEIHA